MIKHCGLGPTPQSPPSDAECASHGGEAAVK